MSHTPGPWSKDCLAIGAKRDRISIKDANGRTLLNMSVYDESDADNARLIAAAPDLLAELKYTQDELRNLIHLVDAQNAQAISRRIQDNDAAITRATGEA